ASFVARKISRRYSISCQVRASIPTSTVAIASLNLVFRKKSSGVMSGDLGGQEIGPPRSIHLPGKCLSKTSRTMVLQ
ncbi:hypothetical protein B7P43_G09558, partial [Cryptotermes secundus]